MESRLADETFEEDDFLAAIQGQRVPQSLGSPLIKLCIVRGIRFHHGFGLELHGSCPEFTRALNARSIMSNEIPELNSPEDIPYCIWYPETASEATYRELVKRYPAAQYQVARACAVAGYIDLYLELEVLPEAAVAEEARDNGHDAIYNAVMSNPIIYRIMDDYTRTIGEKQPTRLNGDTIVRSLLEIKQGFQVPGMGYPEYDPGFDENFMYDITEDKGIDEDDHEIQETDVTELLYTPLPEHLPTVHKDLLISMAAFYGDLDRYTRLRRPMMVEKELDCIIHGIYHNTMFAKWWSLQPLDGLKVGRSDISAAITARFIMNNDLSRVQRRNRSMPYLIWYPGVAEETTYRELAGRRPDMKPQILRACIYADYQALFDELVQDINAEDIYRDEGLLEEPKASYNPYYRSVIDRRAEELGIDLDFNDGTSWKSVTRKSRPTRGTQTLYTDGARIGIADAQLFEFYNGVGADISFLELYVSAPPEWRSKEANYVTVDYVEFPQRQPEDEGFNWDEWYEDEKHEHIE